MASPLVGQLLVGLISPVPVTVLIRYRRACTLQALEPEPEENRVTLLTEEEMNDFDDVGLEV